MPFWWIYFEKLSPIRFFFIQYIFAQKHIDLELGMMEVKGYGVSV